MNNKIYICGTHRTGKTTHLANLTNDNLIKVNLQTGAIISQLNAKNNTSYNYQKTTELNEQEKKEYNNIHNDLIFTYADIFLSYVGFNVAYDRSLVCVLGYLLHRNREHKKDSEILAWFSDLGYHDLIKRFKGEYLVTQLNPSIKLNKSAGKDDKDFLSIEYRVRIQDAIYTILNEWNINHRMI